MTAKSDIYASVQGKQKPEIHFCFSDILFPRISIIVFHYLDFYDDGNMMLRCR